MAQQQNRNGEEIAVIKVAAAVVTGVGSLWLTRRLAATISGHGSYDVTLKGALKTVVHWKHPGYLVAPAYWAIFFLLLAFIAVIALGLLKLVRAGSASSPKQFDERGLASRAEVTRAAGARALLKRASQLRPSLVKPVATDLGFELGRARGVACFSSVEDSTVILGPPRSGKGMNLIIPMILDAPGSVITTSTRNDNLTATFETRSKRGPIGVFDPEGLARGVPGALRWSPSRGCENPLTATTRANVLCASSAHGVTDSEFWQQSTQRVVRDLLHAAALMKCGPKELYEWATDPRAARTAVAYLRDHPSATPGWADELDALVRTPDQTRSGIWAMVSNVFSALGVPEIAEQFSPNDGDELHPEEFVQANGTLYLLGTSTGAVTTARFIAALIEDVVTVARTQASGRIGARLDPPLSLILCDEAANFPLPSITSLMSEGGGTGIATIVVLQGMSQARDKWGKEQASAIWDTATTKIVLGGIANDEDLGALVSLIGEHDVKDVSYSYGARGRDASRTENMRPRAIIDVGRLRAIPAFHALMLFRSSSPALLTLRPWTKRRDADEIKAAKSQLEEQLRLEALRRASGGGK